MPNYQSTKKKLILKTLLSVSLSLYLSYLYKQEKESQTQSDRVTKPKSQTKKKKKHHRQQFKFSVNSQGTTQVHNGPQGTTQAQFLLSMNLRFSDHKVTNILLGFEGKDKSKL